MSMQNLANTAVRRIQLGALALMISVGAIAMYFVALDGLSLTFDYMADPNYAHTLHGIHVARGGEYINTFYPAVFHFLTYSTLISLFTNGAEPVSVDLVSKAVMLCRVGSLLINIAIYACSCITLCWLRPKTPERFDRLKVAVVATFTLGWVMQAPINYYSFLLRPDNGMVLGMLAGIVSIKLLVDAATKVKWYMLLSSAVCGGVATVLLTVSKNQGQPFIVAIFLFGLLVSAAFKNGKFAVTWILVGVFSHLTVGTSIYYLVKELTNTDSLPWVAIVDPTDSIRHRADLASFSAIRMWWASAWCFACAAPAIVLIIGISFKTAMNACFRHRNIESCCVAMGYVAATLFVCCLPAFYSIRQLAVYNLTLPIAAAILAAAVMGMISWHSHTRRVQIVLAASAIFATPLSFVANSQLHELTVGYHQKIITERGSLHCTTYIGSDTHFTDVPGMDASLNEFHEQTHFMYYVRTIHNYDYLRGIGHQIEADPRYGDLLYGSWDSRRRSKDEVEGKPAISNILVHGESAETLLR